MGQVNNSNESRGQSAASRNIFERLATPTAVLASIATVSACAIAALGLALQAFFPTLDFLERNRLSAMEAQATATRRFLKPDLQIEFLVAYSPNLTAQQDTSVLERAGIKMLVLRNAFRDREEAKYENARDAKMRYLFLVIRNAGEILAKDVRLKLDWKPKSKQSLPDGVTYTGTFGPLRGEAQQFALLLDAARELQPSNPLQASHIESICVALTFANEFESRHSENWCAPQSKSSAQSPFRIIGAKNMGIK